MIDQVCLTMLSSLRMSLGSSSSITPFRERSTTISLPEVESALQSSFNFHVRPLLDAVDKLRTMHVTDEGIQLPTIVVVGDQSSGKSSVLESLAQVSLPRGHGIVTRVPLILRLQNSVRDGGCSEVSIEYGTKKREIEEDEICEAISDATAEIAGDEKNIVNEPITLHIKKPDAPDLTMVDLPGITRVPVKGQPADIHDQITNIIKRYISPEETIILNVLNASVDFTTCESIQMSKLVDECGERTLAVVTKVDRSPDKIRDNIEAVDVGLGYICVRNRIDDESHEEARAAEKKLFEMNPHLSDLPTTMVGIPSLAKRLMEMQSESIKKCTPKLFSSIKQALSSKNNELSTLPRRPPSDPDSAQPVAVEINLKVRKVLMNVLAGAYSDQNKQMRFAARLDEKVRKFLKQLASAGEKMCDKDSGTLEGLIDEAKGVTLPNFLQSSVFKDMVLQVVEAVKEPCHGFVREVYEYAIQVTFPVIDGQTKGYSKLTAMCKKVMQAVLEKSRKSCEVFVGRKLEKEGEEVFTYNEQYLQTFQEERLRGLDHEKRYETSAIEETRNSLAAYWKIVQNRLGDEIPLEVRFSLREAMEEFHKRMVLVVADKERLMELMTEDPQLQMRRKKLQNSIQMLERCERIVKKFEQPGLFFSENL